MADRVKAMTDVIRHRVYPGGELVPVYKFSMLCKTRRFKSDRPAATTTQAEPVLAFDTCVPFGMTARQQQAWLGESGVAVDGRGIQ